MSKQTARDLFDSAAERALARAAPLASRMRPESLDAVVGQGHLLSKGAPLRSMLDTGRVGSCIFFGPPGSGKTTVAKLVVRSSGMYFVELSAVSAGVKEVREVLEAARRRIGLEGLRTVLFLDEIHRFSRSQQDALLPGVEDGTVVLIGATTENPYFSLNAPFLSRVTLFRFEALAVDDLEQLAMEALGRENVAIDEAALRWCCDLAEGDVRSVYLCLEVAIAIAIDRARDSGTHDLKIDLEILQLARARRGFRGGRDEHYDLISALIKSVRGSDADASVYWLARLLAQGEDPRFIARRLIILAAEDVGNADPMALVLASAAAEAVDRVGMPEAALHLAQASTYLALAPKSNAGAVAYWEAARDVEERSAPDVPAHLKDTSYRGAASLGHGLGYDYPHNDPRGWVESDYLPEELLGRRYYRPVDRGLERELKERIAVVRTRRAGRPDHDVLQGEVSRETTTEVKR